MYTVYHAAPGKSDVVRGYNIDSRRMAMALAATLARKAAKAAGVPITDSYSYHGVHDGFKAADEQFLVMEG